MKLKELNVVCIRYINTLKNEGLGKVEVVNADEFLNAS